MLTEPPRAGHSVRLTINQVLQDICDQALDDAVRRLNADGGDVVILDPHSGEVRCLSSNRRRVRLSTPMTIVEPFEPGSTLKPFLVARLLELGRATPTEMVNTANGVYEVFGRRITDIHKAASMSVADVIRYSSNVGIARLSERVKDGELFSLYRDLGFGTPTGISFPQESGGTLNIPKRWSIQSHHSLAIGYEIAVTPLQLALAYGAIANGGELMAPALIKDIRDADGRIIYEHQPRPVRRVYDEKTTKTVMKMLESVVDSGTAQDAGLATFDVAGKSGTARRTVGGRYGRGGTQSYTSSFVALFPAAKPQYVVLVKIDNPRGTYYGGKTAAPVAKAIITAAVSARNASLDWGKLTGRQASYLVPPVDRRGDLIRPRGDRSRPAPSRSTRQAMRRRRPDSTLGLGRLDARSRVCRSRRASTSRARCASSRASRAWSAFPTCAGFRCAWPFANCTRPGFRVQLTAAGGGVTSPPAGAPSRTGALVRLSRP